MFSVDAQCSRCKEKAECKNRPVLIKGLSELSHQLNSEADLVDGPGDGRIIVSCADFAVA